MNIKQVTAFKFEGKINFNQEFVLSNTLRPLTKNEDVLVKFVPLFNETYTQNVGRFQVAKVSLVERKPVDEDVLLEKTEAEMPEDHTEDEFEAKKEDVRRELIQYTGFKAAKTPLVVINNETKTILVTASSKVTDDIMGFVLGSFQGDYQNIESLAFEAQLIEDKLTSYLLNESKNLPDQFMLVEKVELGKKSELGKAPKSKTISVTKEYPADEEILTLLTSKNLVVKLLQLEYDGIIDFDVNNKFEIKGIKFKEHLNVKSDEDTTDDVNFMSQMTVQLPELFNLVNNVRSEMVTS